MEKMMEIIPIEYRSPEWFTFRRKKIGGSDAAAVLGLNPYKTTLSLWREKTSPIHDYIIPSDSINTTYGLLAEDHLADLFALDYPQYTVDKPKDVVFVDGFKMASIDLLLTDKQTQKKGFCEIKTVNQSLAKNNGWANNYIPDQYYCQLIHYFVVHPELEYGYIKAQFKSFGGDEPYITTIHRKVLRTDKLNDIEYLIKREDQFWWYVENKKKPPETIYF